MTARARTVACPRCGQPAAFVPANRWRPFCTERCKTVDLGRWAAEEYRLPEAPAAGAPGGSAPAED